MDSDSSILWLIGFIALYALATVWRVSVVKYINLHPSLDKATQLPPSQANFLMQQYPLVITALYLFKGSMALLVGWMGAKVWIKIAAHSPYDHWAVATGGILIMVVLMTLVGDLWVRSQAIIAAQRVLRYTFFLLRLICAFLYPFAWISLRLARLLVRPPQSLLLENQLYSESELLSMIEYHSQIQQEDTPNTGHNLIVNVLQFNEKEAAQIMVPRTKVVAVSVHMPISEIVRIVTEEEYSRVPVYENTIDNIIGILYAKDLLSLMCQQPDETDAAQLRAILRSPLFVAENMRLDRLLRTLQQHRVHMAIVIDRFGGTAGLLTLEDVLEEIVGDIQDEYDNEQPVVLQTEDNRYLIDGLASISDVNKHLPFEIEEKEEYDTIAGLLNYHSGKIPEVGDFVQLDKLKFTVLEKQDNMIVRVELQILTQEASEVDKE